MRKTNNPTCYRQELKDKILTVAMKEFKQKGIRSVKMDDIANLLSISKRTMYEIYADKEHLLLEGVCRNEKYKTEWPSAYRLYSTVRISSLIKRSHAKPVRWEIFLMSSSIGTSQIPAANIKAPYTLLSRPNSFTA